MPDEKTHQDDADKIETQEKSLEDEDVQDEEVQDEETPTDEPTNEESIDEEVVITIDDESNEIEPQDINNAPSWVKEVRKTNRELKKQLKAANERLKSYESKKPIEVGEKPNIEDFDYDSEAFGEALIKWEDRKREVAQKQHKEKLLQEEQNKAWQAQLETYEKKKKNLGVKDFDDVEADLVDTLNQMQVAMIIQGADDPSVVIYALGKNQKLAQELAQIKDPVKFAFRVSKLERSMKVSRRQAPPSPEKRVVGSASGNSAIDPTLTRLQNEASKTGDFTKVVAYRRNKRK